MSVDGVWISEFLMSSQMIQTFLTLEQDFGDQGSRESRKVMAKYMLTTRHMHEFFLLNSKIWV